MPDREPTWVIMPFLNNAEMTLDAVADCLAQTVPTRVLLIDQGASSDTREAIDRFIDERGDHRVLCWHFLPMLPSLSMVWNRALEFVWATSGDSDRLASALVVNNDVRLVPRTLEHLQTALRTREALFVSAVGKSERGWCEERWVDWCAVEPGPADLGGPDFSCFLISHAGHWTYPFDEQFIPAFREDLDAHRRYMLGGDGAKIFSVNVPYLHYASGTLKAYTPEERQRFNKASEGNRAYYRAKWGGDVNEETYTKPFDPSSAKEGVTTPDLQRRVQAGEVVHA